MLPPPHDDLVVLRSTQNSRGSAGVQRVTMDHQQRLFEIDHTPLDTHDGKGWRRDRLSPEKLHRVHASPASGRGGSSFDVGGSSGIRWRGEGASSALKRAVAYRLSFCWNMAEGWPIAALESGAMRKVDDALVRLLDALDAMGLDSLPLNASEAAGDLERLLQERNAHYDLTDGRPHDCEGCLAVEGEDPSLEASR